MKSHSIMQRRIVSEAQKIGLTPGQPKVLDYLYDHEGSDQKTIAAYCEIEPATLASILLRMEQKELIVRRQEHGNRRSLYVYLTKKGKEAAESLYKAFAIYDAQATKTMTPAETEQLKQFLTFVCKNLTE
jgi:DNA-binding MarR family transcriptional regulator